MQNINNQQRFVGLFNISIGFTFFQVKKLGEKEKKDAGISS